MEGYKTTQPCVDALRGFAHGRLIRSLSCSGAAFV